MWGRYCCLTSFFPIVDMCLSCKDMARQSCAMVRRWQIFGDFLRSVLSLSTPAEKYWLNVTASEKFMQTTLIGDIILCTNRYALQLLLQIYQSTWEYYELLLLYRIEISRNLLSLTVCGKLQILSGISSQLASIGQQRPKLIDTNIQENVTSKNS